MNMRLLSCPMIVLVISIEPPASRLMLDLFFVDGVWLVKSQFMGTIFLLLALLLCFSYDDYTLEEPLLFAFCKANFCS